MTADVHCTTLLRCDHPGCKARWPLNGKAALTGHQHARTLAKQDGWTRDYMYRDLCPEHSGEVRP